HPETGGLLAMEVKQHALPFRQLTAEHQPLRLLLRSGYHLNGETVHPRPGDDFERLELERPRWYPIAGPHQRQRHCSSRANAQAMGHAWTLVRSGAKIPRMSA